MLSRKIGKTPRLLRLALVWSIALDPAAAATLKVVVTDQQGSPVEDAVVYIRSIDGQTPASSPASVEVDQVNEMFVPHVRAATVGSSISFPNSDHIRHHVYSFSEARTFEVPLYSGVPAEPILFDKPGVVTLGCNIHDHMLGYILILATPHYVEVHAGTGSLSDLSPGAMEVEIWHPRLADQAAITRMVDITTDAEVSIEVQLDLRPERMVRRAPRRNSTRY